MHKLLRERISKSVKLLTLCLTPLLFSSCAAIGTIVAHGSLETQTMMSDSVFIPPQSKKKEKVYLQVKNTTDKPEFNVKKQLAAALTKKGYVVVTDPQNVDYLLQVNLLQMGKNTETAAKEMMALGYGGALEGMVAGGTIAFIAGATNPVLAGAAMGGAVAETVTDNFVSNVTYSGIVDVRLMVHKPNNKNRDNTDFVRNYTIYQTRILTMAQRVNLGFKTAEPKIEIGIANSISGLFEDRCNA
jgi:hypothetical protein